MRRTLVAAITLLTTTALISGAAVADASASRPDRVRQEHFRIISTVTGSRRQSLLATGAFTAGGYLVPGGSWPSGRPTAPCSPTGRS